MTRSAQGELLGGGAVVGAVVLAAGGGSRFDGPVPKLLAPLAGRPLVVWAVEAALAAGVGEVAVVTGAVALDELLAGTVGGRVAVVGNPDWRSGQASSLRAGIDWCAVRGFDAAVVGVGDQPLVGAAAWRRVAGATHAPIATATFGGRRRPPVRLDRSVWSLVAGSGDEGARELMRRRPDLVAEVVCAGDPTDVDTVDDLRRLEASGVKAPDRSGGRPGRAPARHAERHDRRPEGGSEMELTNEFTVDVPVEEAWTILTDVARIAPCMPGAQLEAVDGDDYRGRVKVKVGPMTAEYRGTAAFLERDADAHRAVLRAEGREARGQGNASATVTATLEPSGGGTRVRVVTDLTITGRVAQFGRGVLADVSNRLLSQFVASLEATVLAGPAAAGEPEEPTAVAEEPTAGDEEPTAGEPEASGSEEPAKTAADPAAGQATEADGMGPRPAAGTEEAVGVDLVRLAGPAIAKRLAAVVGAALVGWVLWRRWGRRPG